jgi:putative transcriptional regulator
VEVRVVRLNAIATVLVLTAAFLCPAQSTNPADLAQGKILVMHRDSPDPLFARSVIVLARYDHASALGLMIHYPSDIPVRRALAGIKGAGKRTDPVFVGGPVELPGVLALLRSHSPMAVSTDGTSRVTGNLYLLSSKQSMGAALSEGRKPSDLRIFAGYAGWGPGQLAREVRLNSWYIFNYDETLVFDDHPETLWQRLIDKTDLQKVLLPLARDLRR